MTQDYKTRAAAMVDEVSKVCMWPGGYPLALLTDDGGVLCPACVRREREQILDAVWGIDFDSATTVVETYVSYLRRKLGPTGPELIKTVRGVGFTVRDPR